MGLGVRLGLGLVTDHNVAEGKHLVHLRLEELGDERRREVHSEALSHSTKKGNGQSSNCSRGKGQRETNLAGRRGLLGEDESGLDSVGQEEASQVEELGSIDESLDLGRSQVGGGEGLGGLEGGRQGSIETQIAFYVNKREKKTKR